MFFSISFYRVAVDGTQLLLTDVDLTVPLSVSCLGADLSLPVIGLSLPVASAVVGNDVLSVGSSRLFRFKLTSLTRGDLRA